MARPLRIELSGGLYHVTSRGDRREDIYFDDTDRQAWLTLLGQVCQRHNWVIHAWCQMSNHYHLVVETPEGNLAQGMRQLNGVYTQHVNRRHRRVGHVFQGRYKAILVEKEGYLLELSRYVVLNPVRAGMVALPESWPWSSYLCMVGETLAPDWLQTAWLLGQFGTRRHNAMAAYADFVRRGVGLPSLWDRLVGQIFLGSPEFAARMAALIDSEPLKEVPRAQRRPLAQPLDHYSRHENRKQGMVAAYRTGDYTMQEIAIHFGVHYATVSRAIKAAEMYDCKT
ncbi:REP element-mobilizing transposase RayT [Andreprevotia lacus DSM 23236]|jgi:REP element-mobilizing transposase RayT|uniref:REP element-mobilizing transposase RayT n=1 Tax=Andreprevotia lacus DSM 23236 TaxID=1121001 RepID=A0A1W1XIQ0_9NEIS|nr:transposase [Andreprevotia lacus]SMC23707.1 REP element-mobilizing transposase RayT [Andreprevotia lacus DSM 23236]